MTQEEIQKALEAIGRGGINVAGDFVLEKKVEYEVANVEAGGIGIQINNSKQVPLSKSDKDIKAAIIELMNVKQEGQKERFLFRNKKQWWAVYKVLHHYCNYPKQATAFVVKMKELEVDNPDKDRALTYDSLSAASKDISKMERCAPDCWNTLKDLGENYRQQYEVADFLMQKLGIK